jgi:hypothetical protein
MIRFKDLESAYELRLLHRTLYSVLRWIVDEGAWHEATGESDLVVTDVWRSQAETDRIYREAGLPAPARSVHSETLHPGDPHTGCRGLDLSVRRPTPGKPYAEWPPIERGRLERFVAAVNEAWRYHPEERYQVALLHDVAGLHVHLQVARENLTARRTD